MGERYNVSYIYTFIRQDLSHEQKIVQSGHACYEAGKKFQDSHGISNMVLLPASNEDELTDIAYNLDMRGIEYYMFYEPDFGTGYSALCTRPIIDKKERNFFKKWELYKHSA